MGLYDNIIFPTKVKSFIPHVKKNDQAKKYKQRPGIIITMVMIIRGSQNWKSREA